MVPGFSRKLIDHELGHITDAVSDFLQYLQKRFKLSDKQMEEMYFENGLECIDLAVGEIEARLCAKVGHDYVKVYLGEDGNTLVAETGEDEFHYSCSYCGACLDKDSDPADYPGFEPDIDDDALSIFPGDEADLIIW